VDNKCAHRSRRVAGDRLMFVTAFALYLVATQGLQLTGWILLGTIVVDIIAWTAVSDSFESWATGTTSDEKFWHEDENE